MGKTRFTYGAIKEQKKTNEAVANYSSLYSLPKPALTGTLGHQIILNKAVTPMQYECQVEDGAQQNKTKISLIILKGKEYLI